MGGKGKEGNIVNNMIGLHSDVTGGYQNQWGDHTARYKNEESLYCTPKTDADILNSPLSSAQQRWITEEGDEEGIQTKARLLFEGQVRPPELC